MIYIKSCDSEELKTLAKNAYDWNIKSLESIKQIKAADPEDLKKSHEIAFYESYNNIIKRCSNPEENGLRPEHAKEMKDTAERAKKYYEEGVITIEQACQAIELGSPSLPYDPTFSLPD